MARKKKTKSGKRHMMLQISEESYELLYGLLQRHGYTSYQQFIEAIVADWMAEANGQRLEDYRDTEVWIDAILDGVADPIIHERERQRVWRKREPKRETFKLGRKVI